MNWNPVRKRVGQAPVLTRPAPVSSVCKDPRQPVRPEAHGSRSVRVAGGLSSQKHQDAQKLPKSHPRIFSRPKLLKKSKTKNRGHVHSTLLCFKTTPSPQLWGFLCQPWASGSNCTPTRGWLLLLTDRPDFRHLCSWKPQPDVHPDKMQRRMAAVLVRHPWTLWEADT